MKDRRKMSHFSNFLRFLFLFVPSCCSLSSEMQNQITTFHQQIRKNHGAEQLSWSARLSEAAAASCSGEAAAPYVFLTGSATTSAAMTSEDVARTLESWYAGHGRQTMISTGSGSFGCAACERQLICAFGPAFSRDDEPEPCSDCPPGRTCREARCLSGAKAPCDSAQCPSGRKCVVAPEASAGYRCVGRRKRAAVVGTFNEVERLDILRKVNGLRSAANATDMRRMVWSYVLAEQALRQARTCSGVPYVPTEVGFPFDVLEGHRHASYVQAATTADVYSGTIGMWQNAAQFYDETTGYCTPATPCAEYTKIATAEKQLLGCAFQRDCRDDGAALFFCVSGTVAPPASGPVFRPDGPPCSRCPSSHAFCEDGLCHSEVVQQLLVSERTDLLREINEMRAEANSSDMRLLIWSDVLAQQAQLQANECKVNGVTASGLELPFDVREHGDINVGGHDVVNATAADRVRAWREEADKYDPADGNCTPANSCNTYKSLVTAGKTTIGCAEAGSCAGTLPPYQRTLVCISGPVRFTMDGPAYNFRNESCAADCAAAGLQCVSDLCHSWENVSCIENVCGPNELCLQTPSGHTCQPANACHQNRKCLNDGVCVSSNLTSFACSCAIGWRGDVCDESVTPVWIAPLIGASAFLGLLALGACLCHLWKFCRRPAVVVKRPVHFREHVAPPPLFAPQAYYPLEPLPFYSENPPPLMLTNKFPFHQEEIFQLYY